MKRFLILCLFVMTFISCGNGKFVEEEQMKESTFLEIYITPKRMNHGLRDNGVYSNPLTKYNLYAPKRLAGYLCPIEKDSLAQRVYLRREIEESDLAFFIGKLKESKIEKNLYAPTIVFMFNNKNRIDTIDVDSDLNVFYKGKTYVLPDSILKDVLKDVPEEIRMSWEQNLPGF